MTSQASIHAPWQFASVSTMSNYLGTVASLASRVSVVPINLTPVIKGDGLRAGSINALKHLMVPAQKWLAEVPELESLVLQVVRDIHPLTAEPGYDTSHSQPQWRETIFVSCPERRDDIGALRLTESIVHEAMHLHLTNVEELSPLVAVGSRMAHSPWRNTDRPVQGVLHGLFVFACIHRFLQMLTTAVPLADDVQGHITRRLDTIIEEMAQISIEDLSCGLTPMGQAVAALWIAESQSTGSMPSN